MTRPSFSCRWAVVVGLLAIGATPAVGQLPSDARFTFEWFTPGGSTPLGSSYSATAGTPFTLQVYLRQTAGATDVLTTEGGLFGGGLRATYGSPTGTPGVIRVAGVSDVQYNPRFNDTVTSDASRVANADYAQFRAVSDGTQAATPSGGRVYLGQFTFQVPGAVNSSTVLRAEVVPGLTSNVTYTNFYQLDPVIAFKDLTVLVVPVPEPVGLTGALAVALVGGAATRRTIRGRAGVSPASPSAGV